MSPAHVFIGLFATVISAVPVQAQPQAAGALPGKPGVTRLALPRMGEAGAMDLAAERQLGELIAQQIYRDPDYLDDPVLGDYLQALWQPLLASAKASGELSPELAERFAWELMLSRDRSINAFAMPGAYLGVHLGLVAAVGTADELASVLAHELTHVTQRHISRLIAKQDQQAPLVIGAMILGALAANAAKNTDVAQAVMVGGQAVAAQAQLNFSRDMEREADRIGFGVMTDAGFDGHGFAGMFDRLQQASRLNDDGAFPYLRSHPLTGERIADMKARLALASAEPPEPQRATPPNVSAQWHAFMAARARVLAEPDVRRLQAWAQEPPTAPASRYAAALSAHRLKQAPAALSLARQLLAQPDLDAQARRAANLLALEIWLMPGNSMAMGATATAAAGADAFQRRLAELADSALAASDRASVLMGAQVVLQQGRPSPVSQRLQVWVTDHPRDAPAWRWLAQAWAAQGQPLRAIRAEAESRMAHLDVDGALDRLRAAREMAQRGAATDHLEMSIIDARYRQLLQRQRELAAERRP